ncbi:MAG: alpha-hydroxy acid oxidase, partial [Ilumatobacteraceae bacterium]
MPRRSPTFISVDHARELARRRLPRPIFDYVDGGADDEVTASRNRRSFATWALRQLTGDPIGTPDLTTTLLGHELAAPVLFAPCGLTGVVHPDGEPAVARSAGRNGTIGITSSFAIRPLEDVARAATGPMWFQLYFFGGIAGAERMVDRAEQAGYDGLVVTLDTSAVGNRERDLRNGVRHPVKLDARTVVRFLPAVAAKPRWLAAFLRNGGTLQLGNVDPEHTGSGDDLHASLVSAPPTWDDVARLRERWGRKLVVKGVMDPVDVRRAIDHGADAVVVSNHGGRQLDMLPATIDVLASMVEAADDQIEVIFDGGIRRGSDIVVALALGARAVCI